MSTLSLETHFMVLQIIAFTVVENLVNGKHWVWESRASLNPAVATIILCLPSRNFVTYKKFLVLSQSLFLLSVRIMPATFSVVR